MKVFVDFKNYNLFIFRCFDRCIVISLCWWSIFMLFFDFVDYRSLCWEEFCLCVLFYVIFVFVLFYDISFFFFGSLCCEVVYIRYSRGEDLVVCLYCYLLFVIWGFELFMMIVWLGRCNSLKRLVIWKFGNGCVFIFFLEV